MASFKLNIARIRGCSPPTEVVRAMEEFALPDNEEFGVLNCSATEQAALATIIRRTHQAVQRLDADAKEVTAEAVERITVYPLAVKPGIEVLEIYAGSAAGIEQVGQFFAGCLGFPTVTESIEVDIPSAIDRLMANTEKFQLRAMRVSDYSHNSFMVGPYAPKFLDTQHGLDFLAEHAETVASATVRFAAPSGRANVKLTARACFGFSCNEEDQPYVQSILRKLI